MDAAGCRTLREILEYRAETTPSKPFVIFDDTHGEIARYSYVDFDKSVNRTARMLGSFGVRSVTSSTFISVTALSSCGCGSAQADELPREIRQVQWCE